MAIFAKFDGVDGECKDKDHINWTEVHNFSFGVSKATIQGSTGSLRRHGDTHVSDFTFSRTIDKASPKLFEACAQGKVFAKVEVHVTASYTDSGRVTYDAYNLEHAQIISYQVTSASDSPGTEHLVLNFEKYKNTYTEHDEKGKKKGNVEATWDLMAGKK